MCEYFGNDSILSAKMPATTLTRYVLIVRWSGDRSARHQQQLETFNKKNKGGAENYDQNSDAGDLFALG